MAPSVFAYNHYHGDAGTAQQWSMVSTNTTTTLIVHPRLIFSHNLPRPQHSDGCRETADANEHSANETDPIVVGALAKCTHYFAKLVDENILANPCLFGHIVECASYCSPESCEAWVKAAELDNLADGAAYTWLVKAHLRFLAPPSDKKRTTQQIRVVHLLRKICDMRMSGSRANFAPFTGGEVLHILCWICLWPPPGVKGA